MRFCQLPRMIRSMARMTVILYLTKFAFVSKIPSRNLLRCRPEMQVLLDAGDKPGSSELQRFTRNLSKANVSALKP